MTSAFICIFFRPVRLEALHDFTFIRGIFLAADLPLVPLSKYLDATTIDPDCCKELKIPVIPVKAGPFHDLPAKVLYRLAAGEDHTGWSSMNGKLNVEITSKSDAKAEEHKSNRWTGFGYKFSFFLVALASFLLPTYQYQYTLNILS